MQEQFIKRDLVRLGEAVAKNRRFAQREKDTGMRNQYTKDATDLLRIGAQVAECNYKKAARLVYNLDTLVRDQIPPRLYNEIMKYF